MLKKRGISTSDRIQFRGKNGARIRWIAGVKIGRRYWIRSRSPFVILIGNLPILGPHDVQRSRGKEKERERSTAVAEEPRRPAAIDLSRLRFLFVRSRLLEKGGCGFRLKRDEHALSLSFFLLFLFFFFFVFLLPRSSEDGSTNDASTRTSSHSFVSSFLFSSFSFSPPPPPPRSRFPFFRTRDAPSTNR